MGRSYHSIDLLEGHFSFPMLVSCMGSHKLPFRLRAAFTSLLVNLYVDRYPQSPLRMPETIQVLHELDGSIQPRKVNLESAEAIPSFLIKDPELLEHPDDKFNIPHSDKFWLCQEFATAYFERIAGKQTAIRANQNEFTIMVMKLVQKLEAFGFFGTIPQVREMAAKAIHCLDGRTDRPAPPNGRLLM